MTPAVEAVVTPAVEASVIVCSRDRPAMLRDTVTSILGGGAVPRELLIIDQSGAPDRQIEGLAAPAGCDLRYVWTRSRGLSRANNEGARLAEHETLVFTHDDVLVDAGWLTTLVAALDAAGPQSAVIGRVLAAEDHPGGFAPALMTSPVPAVYEGRVGRDVLKPMNLAIRRSTLLDAGGFDERLGPGTPFPGAEDSDLGYRLLERGVRIVYQPAAVLHHRAWRPMSELLPLRYGYGVAQGAFYAKHSHPGDLHMAGRFVRDLARRARRFPGRVVREGRAALADPAFIAGNVVGAFRWIRRHG